MHQRTSFPKNYGWRIDREPVNLDALTIKKITWHFTQRKFKAAHERSKILM